MKAVENTKNIKIDEPLSQPILSEENGVVNKEEESPLNREELVEKI